MYAAISPEYDIRGDSGSANREPWSANLWVTVAKGHSRATCGGQSMSKRAKQSDLVVGVLCRVPAGGRIIGL
jgi:hypothetical protein